MKSRSNSIRPASRARLASPDELVVEIEGTKRPAPDAVEPPTKFLTMPAAPSTWQVSAIGTPPQAAAGTPPAATGRGRSVGMGLPDDPISPGPGSGLEEIRLWSQRSVLRLEDQQTTLLREFHLQKTQLNRLREAAERHAVLEARVIALENAPSGHVQLEVSRIEEEVKRQSTGMSSKTEAEFTQLRGELSEFAAKIQVATTHIATVEGEYQQAVEAAFAKAETAIVQVSSGLEQVRIAQHSAGAASSGDGNGASTVNFFDYQLVKDRVEKMEVVVTQILSKLDGIPDCHCIHVESLVREVERINVQITQLGGAGNAETRSLHSRLADVEAALNKAAAGKGVDPWQAGYSSAPIRMPPGGGMPGGGGGHG